MEGKAISHMLNEAASVFQRNQEIKALLERGLLVLASVASKGL